MLSAGLINIVLAIIVWALAKNYIDSDESASNTHQTTIATNKAPLVAPGMLLFIAFFTGLSSFMYEIGWIRMLVLVLGGSTHSFELMLASFILGLALGGLWIRNRIDTVADSRVFLGYAQLGMGIAAVLSIWLYHYSFDWMHILLDTIQRKNSTYPIFLFFSGIIAVVIMLPATFFAGMTLPLITRLIIQTKKKENGIGYVYSANTLGAIAGIFLSVHLIMPWLGLKNLILLGAVTDFLLAFYLLGYSPIKLFSIPKVRMLFSSAGALFFVFTFLFAEFNVGRMSSGVYRMGNFTSSSDTVAFHGDGKTSTVSIVKLDDLVVIKNNGKSDASINLDPEGEMSLDEDTQVLTGVMPLFLKPDAKTAAIIGMGSGMSTHAILGSPNLESVDTVEMEAKVIEGAKYFLPAVDRAYNDARSHLHVEDAKTFFSTHNKSYDIIVSEPPNPWVSGVATLFSQEFYQRIGNHLSDGGVFVQWIQLYEIDVNLVASVFNAMEAEFKDYVVYQAGGGNIIVMASVDSMLPPLRDDALGFEALKPVLTRININNMLDIELNRIGPKRLLAPLFRQTSMAVNSDYFPILDKGAPRARFSGTSAIEITRLLSSSNPSLHFLNQNSHANAQDYTLNEKLGHVIERKDLVTTIEILLGDKDATMKPDITTGDAPDYALADTATLLRESLSSCGTGPAEAAINNLLTTGMRAVAVLSEEDQAPLWDYIAQTECVSGAAADEQVVHWYNLLAATSGRNYAEMSKASTALLLSERKVEDKQRLEYVLSIGMLGDLFQGDIDGAKRRWATYGEIEDRNISFPAKLLLSSIGIQTGEHSAGDVHADADL